MKVNAFFELRMNKPKIKLQFIVLIWELWTVNFSPKGITFHEYFTLPLVFQNMDLFLDQIMGV